MQGHGFAQCIVRFRGSIEGCEDHVTVPGREERALMLGNRDPGTLQRHAGHECRLADAEQGGGPLNLLLDVRLGALLHPRRLRLVDGGGAVMEVQHGLIQSRPSSVPSHTSEQQYKRSRR